ncbi:MAG: helix-turn-helix domain-containing protein [Candidatus Accumulibacter sp.]|jgi:transcriptional regulator with XRE-family HTH domain|nr:helix-turn-helix domain-containing protein [Accumulibacter sp.]
MNVGLIIRQLRERQEWTQDELAHRSGTTSANISRIENGKHNPGTELLGSIAYVLGVRVYELVAMAEGFQPPTLAADFDADEEIIVRQFRKMADEEKELFKAIALSFAKIRQPTFISRRKPFPEAGAYGMRMAGEIPRKV